MMTWQDLHHSELTVPQLYALLKLRSEVFVVEQQCVYQDVDGDDLVGENRHLLGWRDGELSAALAAKGDLPRGAGAPAILLRPLWFYAGDRGL